MFPSRPAFCLLRSAVAVSLLFGTGALVAADDAAHEHTTVRGDTLIGLGKRYLVDPAGWRELARVNRVRNPNRIPVGLLLRIPIRLMRSETVPADVTAVIGDVRSAAGAAVQAGQTLPEGAELRTGADGSVTVRLVDGTLLRLRATSRLQIDESWRLRDAAVVRSGVKLDQGRVEVQAEPATGGRPGFRIGTPQGVLGVRGTEFRVTVDPAKALTRAEVLSGVVAADGAAGTPGQRVAAGFGTQVDGSGGFVPPRPLLAAPQLAGLPVLQERPLVRFVLPALPGAVTYRAQVASDPAFDLVLADLESASPELRIAGLPDGNYLLRVRGADAQGLEGRNADLQFRLKARPEPPLPSVPAPRAVLIGGQVTFTWAANDNATSYRLQLSSGEDFAAPLRDERNIRALTLSIDGLPPGRYAWRLASVRGDSDQGPFGSAQTFELRPPPPPPPVLPPPAVSDKSIRFAWAGLPGQRFDFQLSRDAAFTTLLLERQLAEPSIELPLPGSGRFFIRLRARDPDGFVGPFTAPQHFDLPNCVRDSSDACVLVGGQPLLATP